MPITSAEAPLVPFNRPRGRGDAFPKKGIDVVSHTQLLIAQARLGSMIGQAIVPAAPFEGPSNLTIRVVAALDRAGNATHQPPCTSLSSGPIGDVPTTCPASDLGRLSVASRPVCRL